MSRYGSSFREPPWVIGSSKEVMDWVDATHPKKDRKDKVLEEKYLINLHVKLDFDVPQKEIETKGFIAKIFGRKNVEEDFDLIISTKLILRGLAKAKFHNTAKIVVDNKTLYHHPEKKSDLKKTINILDDFSEQLKNGKTVEVTSMFDDAVKSTVIIKLKKIHYLDEHSVDILIKGKIRKDIYNTFLNYLQGKIGFREYHK
jgi:hypothetical protein